MVTVTLCRRIRPKKAALEHNDSVSSGEEDDDDGFEILTAENLFSTLLSRVSHVNDKHSVPTVKIFRPLYIYNLTNHKLLYPLC